MKASDMSRADGGMSGYAALTRPTELKIVTDGIPPNHPNRCQHDLSSFFIWKNKSKKRSGKTCPEQEKATPTALILPSDHE